jgi:hypothetical protein
LIYAYLIDTDVHLSQIYSVAFEMENVEKSTDVTSKSCVNFMHFTERMGNNTLFLFFVFAETALSGGCL